MRILVVDDEEAIRFSVGELLRQRHGCTVMTATDGEDALQVLETEAVDHVITDHRMPRLTGLALLERLHQDRPDVTATLMTAYRDPELAAQVQALGYGFVEKSMDLDPLLAELERITGSSA